METRGEKWGVGWWVKKGSQGEEQTGQAKGPGSERPWAP